MTNATRRLVPGALATLLLAGLGGCGFSGLQDLPLPGGPRLDDPYTVTAEFRDVLSLAPHATVKVDGVTVGEVVSIERRGWHAEVRLSIDGDVVLAEDATARIQQTSLLGEKFVSLDDGGRSGPTVVATTERRLSDGDRIPLARTSRGTEVEEVLGAVSLLLNGGGLDNLRTITTELHQGLGADDVDTRRFLTELSTFVTTLDEQRHTILATLRNVDRLARQLNRGRAVVERALDRLAPAIRSLADQRRPLVRMLRHLDRFGRITISVIEESGADLAADLRALEPVLAALEESGDELPEALEAILSFPFPNNIWRAVHGDYTNLAVEIDLTPLTLLGNATGEGPR